VTMDGKQREQKHKGKAMNMQTMKTKEQKVSIQTRDEYIRTKTYNDVLGCRLPQLSALRKGFLSCKRISQQLAPLSPSDLRLLFVGEVYIDVNRLIDCLVFEGYSARSVITKKAFGEVLKSLTRDQLRQFLLFTTNDDVLSFQREERITIRRVPRSDNVPAARTCFRILDVPDYASVAILKKKLLISIKHNTGYGFI